MHYLHLGCVERANTARGGAKCCIPPSQHTLSAIFPVVHKRNRCFYWFIVLWFLLMHVLLWEMQHFPLPPSASVAQLYCTVSTIQTISRGHSCSDALLNKDRRVDQLLPWRAPGLGTLCYPELSSGCSAGFVPHLFE